MRPYDPSPDSLAPLMATFWSGNGWREPPAWPEPGIMRRAMAAGVMFAPAAPRGHDDWVRTARDAAGRLSGQEVADAFLASFASRRLDLRSALGSYAVARHLPEHPFTSLGDDYDCGICGLPRDENSWSPNELNFERFKWGGVRRDSLEYVAFDLEQFAHAPRLQPTSADIEIGQQALQILRSLPPDTTAAKAGQHLKVIPGNKDERNALLDILGVCGILETIEYPGYAENFILQKNRKWPDARYIFWHYPICWWRVSDGVNQTALKLFLPQLIEYYS